jgi:hemerythrin-like domain-containing protein
MKCTEVLIEDHKIVSRALDVLDEFAARVKSDAHVSEEDVETILRFLREFADNHHQGREESALFPQLMNTSISNKGPLHQMIFEHDQERSLVEGLEEALHTKKGDEFVHFASRLTSLMRAHIDKEDKVLFKIAELTLTGEQDDSVARELNKYEVRPGLLADLQRLEWSYLGRVAA